VRLKSSLGVRPVRLEHVMFKAADPEVFGWYLRDYGPEVNFFLVHSQIVQFQALRSGL
jgi:phosphosulfolactate synthase (CoM biosynthesis protein A)